MTNKDELIKNLHKVFRQDPFINELFNSAGLNLNNIESTMNDMGKQYWTDTVTWGLGLWERPLGIKPFFDATIDDRRSMVEAKWKSDGKVDIYLLQAIADSWKNGKVKVEFINGKIKITFNGIYGIPEDLQGLEKALDDVKPSHLAIVYAFAYLLIKDINNVMTIEQLEKQALSKFAF